MRKYKKIIFFLVVVALSGSLVACGARLPKPKTAQGALKSYFKSYGKDYKASDFGQFKVDKVEIADITERQKGMVAVEAYISLGDGDVIYKVRATLLKKTLYWRVISWENLGKSS